MGLQLTEFKGEKQLGELGIHAYENGSRDQQ